MIIEQNINDFFHSYQELFKHALEGKTDIEPVAQSFANCFLEASPLGVNCGKNDDEFRKMIPKGYEFYRSIGTKAMNILSKDITYLDDFHTMVKVHWKADYIKKDKQELSIEFDVIYFLQDLKNTLKIFAYITGDEKKVMKEHGLIEEL
jgi:hypothetical protein